MRLLINVIFIALLGSLLGGCFGASYRSVQEDFARGNFEGVVEELNRIQPDDPELLFIQGESHRELENYPEMMTAYEGCKASSSEFDDLIHNRIEHSYQSLLLEMHGDIQQNHFEEAAAHVANLDVLKPQNHDILPMKAFVFDSLRYNDLARDAYGQMIEQGTGDLDLAKNRMITLLMEDGLFSESTPIIEACLQEDPQDLTSHLFLIESLAGEGKHDDVIAAIKRAEQTLSGRLEFSLTVGVYYFNQREYEVAAAYFQKVIEADPVNPLAWYRLGECSFNRYDFLSAQESFERVITLVGVDFQQVRPYFRVIALYLGREDRYHQLFGEGLEELDLTDLHEDRITSEAVAKAWSILKQPVRDEMHRLANENSSLPPLDGSAPADDQTPSDEEKKDKKVKHD
jgi:tetratricopeptide (TPR) repeat protein